MFTLLPSFALKFLSSSFQVAADSTAYFTRSSTCASVTFASTSVIVSPLYSPNFTLSDKSADKIATLSTLGLGFGLAVAFPSLPFLLELQATIEKLNTLATASSTIFFFIVCSFLPYTLFNHSMSH